MSNAGPHPRRGSATSTAGPSGPSRADKAGLRRDGLRFWSDDGAAIRRVRAGRGFIYRRPDGKRVTDPATHERIRGLAIPPAWTDVRIAPRPDAHLQATGRDARGRKQYRYHPDFRARREAVKFDGLVAFARALPRIRARVRRDFARPGLPREKVLAAVVRLLQLTLVRVGNDEYARLNRSFGLTTLRDRHATITGAAIRFRFRAKSGQMREVSLRDRRLARVVSRCQDIPGQELFQYLDEAGEPRSISSEDVNDYLREASGIDVTAKMFRTWAATVLACRALGAVVAEAEALAGSARLAGVSATNGAPPSTVARRQVLAAMRMVADRLGNTAAVVRQSYVHPAVIDTFLDGRLGSALVNAAETLGEMPAPTPAEERAVIRLLVRGHSARTAARRVLRAQHPAASSAD
jgi:DNA topoisomerase-1